MSKETKIFLAIGLALVFIVACVGGWFFHLSLVKKDYEKAWAGYTKEVRIWKEVDESYRLLEPMCGELAGGVECNELTRVGKEADKVADTLPLDIQKVSSPSSDDTEELEKATREIETERVKLEPAVQKVEKAAEATIQDKFSPTLEEAEKKTAEASSLSSSLSGKVKDASVLTSLKKSIDALNSVCSQWKGKNIPTGHEGMQAYLDLKRHILTLDDAINKAKASHEQWQKEEDERKAKEMVKDVNISDGATLSGTVVREGCGDENLNYGSYMLHLDNPVMFHADSGSGPLRDGSSSVTLTDIQITEMGNAGSGWCGSVDPWESNVGKHVRVSGSFLIDAGTAHYHGPVVFTNARLVQ